MRSHRLPITLSIAMFASLVVASGTLADKVRVETTDTCTVPQGEPAEQFGYLGRYSVGATASGQTAAEIIAVDKGTMYVMAPSAIEIVDIADPANPVRQTIIALPGDPTSVAVNDGLVAVSVPAAIKTDPGRVLLFRGIEQVGEVIVGALPDMVVFTPDGKLLAVANEAEPNSYGQVGSVDPEGSISVIETRPFRHKKASKRPIGPQQAATIGFADFNIGGTRNAELPPGVRIFGPGSSIAQDLEPEYITIAKDNQTAWVSLQENNALAEIDLKSTSVRRITDLGTSDHSRPGFGFDASDQGGAIDIRNWPVKGLYQPDGIANYRVRGEQYVLTANEGDARDWVGISSNGEEMRRAASVADTALFPDAAVNTALGRLNVTPKVPATVNAAGNLTSLYSIGSRSFSIRAADGSLVWDSGDDFECITSTLLPTRFNASNSNDTLKNRSDDKGPEPESVVVGKIDGRHLAFIALERIGGVMVYDITDPTAPTFRQYLTTRAFGGATVGPDSGPEGMVFISESDSPTGEALLVYGNEVTGTVALWGLPNNEDDHDSDDDEDENDD